MPPADPFLALAEPRRRAVMAVLAGGERSAGEIAAHFDVTRQAVSQHLRTLLEAGLVAERRAGTRRFYSARPEGIEEIRAQLDAMWPSALGRLKQAAEAEHRGGRRNAERN